MKKFKGKIILTRELLTDIVCKYPTTKTKGQMLPKGLVFDVAPSNLYSEDYTFEVKGGGIINKIYKENQHSKVSMVLSLEKCNKYWNNKAFKLVK